VDLPIDGEVFEDKLQELIVQSRKG